MTTLERVKYRVSSANTSTWSGITMFSGAKYTLGVVADDNGIPITGLTEDSVKMVKGEKVIVEGTRRMLEKELGMEENYLRKGNIYQRNPFWDSFNIPIRVGGLELNGEDPSDYLKILVLAAHPAVALGQENVKSLTEFVIYSPAKAAKVSNEGRKVRRKAATALYNAALDARKDLMFIYGVNPKSMTEDEIDIFLDDQIYIDPDKFYALVTDENADKKAFILRCVAKHKLVNSNGMIKRGENILGNTIPEAVSALFSEKNEKFLATLKSELEQ